jgi:hypothetical protein
VIECRDRLRELSVAAFGAFVADLAEREWAAWDAETAPPSPDGNVEICLRRGEERLFVHARHAGASGSVGRQAVRNLVSLQGSRGIRTAVLATNGDLSRSARREATVSEVEVLEPESLCRLASDHGVDPSAPPREPRIDAGVANEIAHYPDELRERATQLLTTLASFAQFERDVTRDEHGTTVTFSSNGDAADPVVRVRYEPSELRVYARLPGGEFDTLVRLSAARTEQPPMTDLEPVLRAGVDRALDVDGGR